MNNTEIFSMANCGFVWLLALPLLLASLLYSRRVLRQVLQDRRKILGIGNVTTEQRQRLRAAGYYVRRQFFSGEWRGYGDGYIALGCLDADEAWWRCWRNYTEYLVTRYWERVSAKGRAT